MDLVIVAVGERMPRWADAAWDEYAKRFPRELRVILRAVKTEPRHGGRTPQQAMAAERERIAHALPKGAYVVALDERGAAPTTPELAARLRGWERLGQDIAFVIGGPDGLDAGLRAGADWCLRLSNLVLPHALARVLLIEQLYRAWSITAGHPYHRA